MERVAESSVYHAEKDALGTFFSSASAGEELGREEPAQTNSAPARQLPEGGELPPTLALGSKELVTFDCGGGVQVKLRCYVREEKEKGLYITFVDELGTLTVKKGRPVSIIRRNISGAFTGTDWALPLQNPAGSMCLFQKAKSKVPQDSLGQRMLKAHGGI